MLVCVSTFDCGKTVPWLKYFNTVDQQAALRWVQKYVSLLILMVDIRDRKMILLFLISLFFRLVNSVETRIKLRSGGSQPVLAQFYNMSSQMVGKHRHLSSEPQLRARFSCHLNTITMIAFQRYVHDIVFDPSILTKVILKHTTVTV